MIRAEIRRSSDGVQILGLVFNDADLLDIIAGPVPQVLGVLPDFGVEIGDVEGMHDEWRELWGVRKEPFFQLDNSRQLEGGAA